MTEETSARVASIAAKFMNFQPDDADELGLTGDPNHLLEFCEDIRTLAGSALTQTPNKAPGDFFDRLKAERDDLDVRLVALNSYLSNNPSAITPRHKAMLEEQSKLMSDLLAVLDERIADIEISRRSNEMENTDGE